MSSRTLPAGHFVSVMLLLVMAVGFFRFKIDTEKTNNDLLVKKIAHLEGALTESQFRERVAKWQQIDQERALAKYLPESIRGKVLDGSSYALRSIASVVNEPNQSVEFERGSTLMSKAKEKFQAAQYEESCDLFESLLRSFPDSIYSAEARFLLAEGRFQLKDFEASVAVIEDMIRLYPNNELTGFALLRLAKIYELRDRLEDAAEVYRGVLNSFTQNELRNEAEQALHRVDL